MKLKYKPEDFVVREAFFFEDSRQGEHHVYLMDKQKLSTFEAIERIATAHRLRMSAFSFCGLKDKQGRTEQIIAVRGSKVSMQDPDLRLKPLGRTASPLSAANLSANRFVVTVRDLSIEEAERVPDSVDEVRRLGVVNYFDSQRFGGVKHGQGFLAKDLAAGRVEHALRGYLAQPSPLDKSQDAKVKAFWARNWGDWSARCPYPRVAHYRPVLRKLRIDPRDFAGAFGAIELRYRTLLLFEYQSYIWNEAVRRYLIGRLGKEGLLALRYQAGHHLFPRGARDRERVEQLARMAFPLAGPQLKFEDPEVEKAVKDTLVKEKLTLESLGLPALPRMGMKHEDRPLIVFPEKLTVVDPRPDEIHPGRLKVTLAFTLATGAYATLVVRRTLWFASPDTLEAGGPLPRPTAGFVPRRILDEVASSASRAQGRRNRRARPSHGITAENKGSRHFDKGAPPKTGRASSARSTDSRRVVMEEGDVRERPGRRQSLGMTRRNESTGARGDKDAPPSRRPESTPRDTRAKSSPPGEKTSERVSRGQGAPAKRGTKPPRSGPKAASSGKKDSGRLGRGEGSSPKKPTGPSRGEAKAAPSGKKDSGRLGRDEGVSAKRSTGPRGGKAKAVSSEKRHSGRSGLHEDGRAQGKARQGAARRNDGTKVKGRPGKPKA